MNKKQKDEILCAEYFIPKNYSSNNVYVKLISDNKFINSKGIEVEKSKDGKTPEECYFDYTSRGIKTHKTNNCEKFFKLLEGNRWRNIHIFEMYEPGILEGTWSYSDLLEMPDYVIDYVSKQIFKGSDEININLLREEIKNGKTTKY